MNTSNQSASKFANGAGWWFIFTVVSVYALLNLVTVLHHEPWRDEAQAWLVSRDASVMEFFRLRPYDVNPCVWGLLLMPFAKAGLPYMTMLILHWAIAVAFVFLLTWKAPFSRLTKVLLVFSYYFFWEYCIHVRMYAISILFLFLIAVLYRQRFRRPLCYGFLVALLFNTHAHIFGLATGIVAVFIVEIITQKIYHRRVIWGLLLMIAGAAAAVWQLKLPPDTPNAGMLLYSMAPVFRGWVEAFFIGAGPVEVLLPAAVVVLLLSLYVVLSRPVPLMMLLAHLIGMAVIMFVHLGGPRHFGNILAGIFFCLWIAFFYEDGRQAWVKKLASIMPSFDQRVRVLATVLNVCLIISIPYGLTLHVLEIRYDYSGSKKMAQFIRDHDLDQYPIAAHRDAQTMSILPYLQRKQFWYPITGRYGTYLFQNKQRFDTYTKMSYPEALQSIQAAFPYPAPLLILLDAPLDPGFGQQYALLYKVDSTVFSSDERFYLYIRNRGATGSVAPVTP